MIKLFKGLTLNTPYTDRHGNTVSVRCQIVSISNDRVKLAPINTAKYGAKIISYSGVIKCCTVN